VAPKSRESQLAWFRDSHSGVLGEKSHLDVGFVARHRVYYKGEGGGFPQVRALVSLVCPCCSWLILAPKVLQLCTNHFVWVVCRPVWVSEACQFFLVPSWSSNTPFYPSKCCELGSVPRLFPLPLSFTWTHIWVFPRVGSASHIHKSHHNLDLGEAITFPLIVFFMINHGGYIQMSFCLGTPNFGVLKFPKLWLLQLWRPITFFCKPPIEVRCKEKL